MEFTGFDEVQKMMMVQALKARFGGVLLPINCKVCGAAVEQYHVDLKNGIVVIDHLDHTHAPCELRFIIEAKWFEV